MIDSVYPFSANASVTTLSTWQNFDDFVSPELEDPDLDAFRSGVILTELSFEELNGRHFFGRHLIDSFQREFALSDQFSELLGPGHIHDARFSIFHMPPTSSRFTKLESHSLTDSA